ncbi:MAG: Gfo/Idh/MocA family oxidoreductase [Armatimonadetes bacterium]|nr:Gfo/Idh/MocA family oxidoreductase [Armatimonadota bacterium]
MSKLRIGIIGTGMIARTAHLPGYSAIPDKCEVMAVADVNPDKGKDAAAKFNVAKTFTDYRDLLAMPEIDAVSVATPNALHKQITVDALNAGKHVLCEKPMAMKGEECREMIRAQRESGKLLQIALQWRFGGPIRFMRQYIDNGHMGEIYYARSMALRRREVPGWGVFIDKEKQGGGPLIDIGVHILDLTLYLMGYPKPVSASGVTFQKMGPNPKHYNAWGDYDRSKFTVEDFAVGLIRFENGASITLESSFMGNMEKEFFGCHLFGTDAGALLDLFSDKPITIYSEVQQQLFDMVPQNIPAVKSMYDAEVEAFVDAIVEGKPSPVPGEQGLILNAIFDALYKSSDSGKDEPVDVSV